MRSIERCVWAASIGLGFAASTGHAGQGVIDLGRGPVIVHVPSSYDGTTPVPLLLLLHGYTNTGAQVESYLQFVPVAEAMGMVYLHPDGTEDILGFQFWNATDACCDLFGSGVDDSTYLRALIDEVRSQYVIDDRRVYVAGHSNGGFMSYRMACDHADIVAPGACRCPASRLFLRLPCPIERSRGRASWRDPATRPMNSRRDWSDHPHWSVP